MDLPTQNDAVQDGNIHNILYLFFKGTQVAISDFDVRQTDSQF